MPRTAPERVRCAVVPPVPVPYREPLFARLASAGGLELLVIYQAPGAPGWDQPGAWFPERHAYDAIHLRAWQRSRPGRSPLLWPRRLEWALHEFGPDCVVVSEFGPASLRALAWCRLARRPLVIFTDVTRAMEPALSRGQLAVHRWLARRSAGFVAGSSAARERLLALGVPPEAVEVSLQSLDAEPIRAAVARRPRRARRTVRFLAVGRLVPDKNLAGLIDAFARARLGEGEAELEIWGSGPLEDELRDLARRLGVPARLRGFVAPTDLPRVYAEADALALVSTYEPFGVVVREAVAAGLPVICSRSAGAASDIALDGRNALLVDPTSVSEIAAALRRLTLEPGLRASMARESAAIDAANGIERDVAAFERAVMRAAGRGATAGVVAYGGGP